MQRVVLPSYSEACPVTERESAGILCGASHVPGSKTLRYIPLEPQLHKYSFRSDCGKAFMIPIVWKSEEKNTDLYRRISHRLRSLPLMEKGSKVVYMKESEGYFFDLRLEGGIRVTITQYEDESEKGAYVNVTMDGEVLVQDFMSIDDIVSAMKEYYDGGES